MQVEIKNLNNRITENRIYIVNELEAYVKKTISESEKILNEGNNTNILIDRLDNNK